MTRDELIEKMARAAVNHFVTVDEAYVGNKRYLRSVMIDGQVDLVALMSVVLAIVEAAEKNDGPDI